MTVMARFKDLRTGDVITIEGHARVKHHRQMRSRFEELSDTANADWVRPTFTPVADTVSDPGPTSPEPEWLPAGMTVAETVEWVGTDERRRVQAFAHEKAGKNRKTLIAALTD